MIKDRNVIPVIKTLFPRFLKAAVLSSLTYLIIYHLPMKMFPLEEMLSFKYYQMLELIIASSIFFVAINQLFSGTVFVYAFGIAKILIFTTYLIYFSNGGFISFTIPVPETTVNFMVDLKVESTLNFIVDLRVFLAMVLSINLLTFTKNILQLINFLSKKVETDHIPLH